jgi:glycosyltransferase involved in cell wall biosynthesis
VQWLCVKAPQQAFTFARLTARRLRELGVHGEVVELEREYHGTIAARAPLPAEPRVVFAGRHIPEKQAPLAVEAIALARARLPALRGTIFGDGPERPLVLARIRELGLEGVVEAPGFVEAEVRDAGWERALCLLHPSTREGYGLVVLESAALGVPVVVVDHPDNAAVELVQPGVNGFVAARNDAAALADAIVRVSEAGGALRESTAAWFAREEARLAGASPLEVVVAAYAGPGDRPAV